MEIDPSIVNSFLDAAVSDHEGAAKMLRDYPDLVNARVMWGETCLHYLATEGFANSVRFLANHGFDVNAANEYGDRPLFDAAAVCDNNSGCRDVVLTLLENGANPNEASSYGRTPLLQVVEKGDIELVQALLDRGADPNQADDFFGPPLGVAVKIRRADIVALLLARGAKTCYRTTLDDDVGTHLHRDDESIRQLLIDHGWRS